MRLRPYQEEAVLAVVKSRLEGERSGLLVLPTGAGKTVIFSKIIAAGRGRALVLAHRDELVRQSVDKLLAVDASLDIGIVQGKGNGHHQQVVVASVQTLSKSNRLAQVAPTFGIVVTDEAHHAAAASYQRIYEHLGAGTPGGPYHLGVTATPARTDREDLAKIFEKIVFEVEMRELIDAKYLAPMHGKAIALNIDFDALKLHRGDFRPAMLAREMIRANAPRLIMEGYLEHAQGRRAIAFLPGVGIAEQVAESLTSAGVPSAVITGGTPLDERQAIYKALRDGGLSVISSCMVLTEGFDEPSVDYIIVGRATSSLPLYTQMVGRGSRLYPGKDDCLVIDLTGISHRHKIQSLSDLFGADELRPELSYRETLKAKEQETPWAEAEAEADEVQVSFVDVAIFASSELAWVETLGGHMTLRLKDSSTLCITRVGDAWRLSHIVRGEPETVLGIGTFERLEVAAMCFADASGSKRYVRREAYWRQSPAIDKQRQTLLSMGHGLPRGATKGEASDLLARVLNDRMISWSRQLATTCGNLTAVA
jgi:ATP-dependent helicase IRC3